jgi:hypothetical protein
MIMNSIYKVCYTDTVCESQLNVTSDIVNVILSYEKTQFLLDLLIKRIEYVVHNHGFLTFNFISVSFNIN